MSKKKHSHLTSSSYSLTKEDNDTINALREENRYLKRQMISLRSELEELRGKEALLRSGGVKDRFERQAQSEALFSKKGYFSYVFTLLRSTSVFKIYSRLIELIKRYTFITTSIKVASLIIALLESSAIFVLATSFFVIWFPITLLAAYVGFIFSFFTSRKLSESLSHRLSDKKITVFYPQRSKNFGASHYLRGLIMSFAEEQGGHVIVVSPYLLSSKGAFGKRKSFFLAAEEAEGVTIIRRHYYFQFKKKILSKKEDLTEIF